ncbi:hypothetical protein CGRA01v4_03667 [Colletotrichum graminicola]|uniref:Amidase domain-containing protein n=1 Tax=Colletotrichum graminicola (strain M1.001 / M2 / FGSC 10212) TaxID=645133 RepID=E3QFX4_COLGM|nr:uncharacterized protein GLRG_04953 [Colletotrichum graminicola M1.001]EFQ29809.1 hypothetical protein GLRG_04953 [Colletotrichum graminicola M1.001]WDK12388.1 hypothetical protein CGRA01v4_03667 [Colletotrichum graminicola]
MPQDLMPGECANYPFGRAVCPDDTGLSAGGSSGGEGSLVALGGSPLDIGTDDPSCWDRCAYDFHALSISVRNTASSLCEQVEKTDEEKKPHNVWRMGRHSYPSERGTDQ